MLLFYFTKLTKKYCYDRIYMFLVKRKVRIDKMNELLLILSLIVLYGGVLLFYKFFGKTGLYCWTVLATIAANIEVSIVVRAFGLEQTLGNILFATTFVVTDILSETAEKKEAQKAVILGIVTSIIFIFLSNSWGLYVPSESDNVQSYIKLAFANTPRVIASSIIVYAIVQTLDVFFYHFIWNKTTEICKDSRRFLWLRNNAATILSQLLNAVLFTFFAFYGVHSLNTIFDIIISSFLIFVITSLLDTPVVYLARKIFEKEKNKNNSKKRTIGSMADF